MRAPQGRQRRRSLKSQSIPLHVKLPAKNVRANFLLVYELKGAQEFLNLLARHYGVKRVKIIVDGRKVRNRFDAWYFENKACFKKKGLKKSTILHEFYHHILSVKRYELRERTEEKEANAYANRFLKS